MKQHQLDMQHRWAAITVGLALQRIIFEVADPAVTSAASITNMHLLRLQAPSAG